MKLVGCATSVHTNCGLKDIYFAWMHMTSRVSSHLVLVKRVSDLSLLILAMRSDKNHRSQKAGASNHLAAQCWHNINIYRWLLIQKIYIPGQLSSRQMGLNEGYITHWHSVATPISVPWRTRFLISLFSPVNATKTTPRTGRAIELWPWDCKLLPCS